VERDDDESERGLPMSAGAVATWEPEILWAQTSLLPTGTDP